MRSFRITLFFQDPMSGIFDYHVKESGVNTKSYYQNIQKCMKECAKKTGKYQLFFSFYEKLAAVLADKADLGMCIKSAYRFIQEIKTILTEWFWFPFLLLQISYNCIIEFNV